MCAAVALLVFWGPAHGVQNATIASRDRSQIEAVLDRQKSDGFKKFEDVLDLLEILESVTLWCLLATLLPLREAHVAWPVSARMSPPTLILTI